MAPRQEQVALQWWRNAAAASHKAAWPSSAASWPQLVHRSATGQLLVHSKPEPEPSLGHGGGRVIL